MYASHPTPSLITYTDILIRFSRGEECMRTQNPLLRCRRVVVSATVGVALGALSIVGVGPAFASEGTPSGFVNSTSSHTEGITVRDLPIVYTGTSYSSELVFEGTSNYVLDVSASDLPPGLVLQQENPWSKPVISGQATHPGTYPVTIKYREYLPNGNHAEGSTLTTIVVLEHANSQSG
jgi:hypothetical protein